MGSCCRRQEGSGSEEARPRGICCAAPPRACIGFSHSQFLHHGRRQRGCNGSGGRNRLVQGLCGTPVTPASTDSVTCNCAGGGRARRGWRTAPRPSWASRCCATLFLLGSTVSNLDFVTIDPPVQAAGGRGGAGGRHDALPGHRGAAPRLCGRCPRRGLFRHRGAHRAPDQARPGCAVSAAGSSTPKGFGHAILPVLRGAPTAHRGTCIFRVLRRTLLRSLGGLPLSSLLQAHRGAAGQPAALQRPPGGRRVWRPPCSGRGGGVCRSEPAPGRWGQSR